MATHENIQFIHDMFQFIMLIFKHLFLLMLSYMMQSCRLLVCEAKRESCITTISGIT